jgi:hypothetical protein
MVDRPPGLDPSQATSLIVGSFDSEPFAAGLRTLLEDTGEFDVISVDDPDTLGSVAVARDADLLIAEGEGPPDWTRLLQTTESGRVLFFDSVGSHAFVGVRNPDLDELVRIIRSVTARQDGPGVTVSESHQPGTNGSAPIVKPSPSAWAATDSQEFEALMTWLQLGLGLALLRQSRPAGPGIPGWSVSAQEALLRLGVDPATQAETTQAEQLRLQWDELDAALAARSPLLPGALARLADEFCLTERDLRLLCWIVGPEIDGSYATAIGVLHDDLTCRYPSPTLLADLPGFEDTPALELQRHLDSTESLVAKGLVQPVDRDRPASQVGYRPTPVVTAHLTARSVEDFVAASGATLVPIPPDRPAPASDQPRFEAQEHELRLALASGWATIYVTGGERSRGWAHPLLAAAGLRLVVGDLRSVDVTAHPDAIGDWVAVSRLTGSALLILGLDDLAEHERRQALTRLATVDRVHLLLSTDDPTIIDEPALGPSLVLHAPPIGRGARARWWRAAADEVGHPLSPIEAEHLAATVPIEAAAMPSVLTVASHRWQAGPTGDPVSLVQEAARQLFPSSVPPGGRRIVPVYGWDDIVLPEPTLALLRSIPTHLVKSATVMEQWRFAGRMPYGQGVAVLFSGPSGTGKTMAAQVIAGELGVEILHVDLSKTVSKYIGETEKNLDRLFESAERSGAVLLFDEADAIFGKRTEVKDAHDRHANVEVAYLLQRMEAFQGLAILTTNLKQNIDNAFFRRLRFVVDFALPTSAERQVIWQRVFPNETPLAPDLDVSFLARRLPIPGGSIQNIAVHAAYLAAEADEAVGPGQVLAATRRELIKIGMFTAERSLDDLAA